MVEEKKSREIYLASVHGGLSLEKFGDAREFWVQASS